MRPSTVRSAAIQQLGLRLLNAALLSSTLLATLFVAPLHAAIFGPSQSGQTGEVSPGSDVLLQEMPARPLTLNHIPLSLISGRTRLPPSRLFEHICARERCRQVLTSPTVAGRRPEPDVAVAVLIAAPEAPTATTEPSAGLPALRIRGTVFATRHGAFTQYVLTRFSQAQTWSQLRAVLLSPAPTDLRSSGPAASLFRLRGLPTTLLLSLSEPTPQRTHLLVHRVQAGTTTTVENAVQQASDHGYQLDPVGRASGPSEIRLLQRPDAATLRLVAFPSAAGGDTLLVSIEQGPAPWHGSGSLH